VERMTEQDKVTVDDIIGIVKTEEQTNSVEEVRKLRGRETMTEKRFTKYVHDSYNYTSIITIVDHETNKRSGSIDDFVDMLNNLHEENQQLQSRINDYNVALKTLQDLCERKLKENEQLKQENKELKSLCKVLITHVKKKSIAVVIDEDIRRLLE
jgi:flagellar motility protein MotE (MotC chaperone)